MSRYVTLCDVWPPAGAGQLQRGEGDVVHAGLLGLHRDAGQLVHRHGARLARQVAVELLPVLVPPAAALALAALLGGIYFFSLNRGHNKKLACANMHMTVCKFCKNLLS